MRMFVYRSWPVCEESGTLSLFSQAIGPPRHPSGPRASWWRTPWPMNLHSWEWPQGSVSCCLWFCSSNLGNPSCLPAFHAEARLRILLLLRVAPLRRGFSLRAASVRRVAGMVASARSLYCLQVDFTKNLLAPAAFFRLAREAEKWWSFWHTCQPTLWYLSQWHFWVWRQRW